MNYVLPIAFCLTLIATIVILVVRRNRRLAQAAKTSTGPVRSAPLRSAITSGDDTPPLPAAQVETPSREEEHSEPNEHEADEQEADPTVAELIAQGDQHKHDGEYDEAIEAYESAQDGVTEAHGRDSLEFADLLVRTEDAYYARDNEDDGSDLNCNNYLRALSIMERRLGVFDVRLVPVLNRIAAFYLLVDKPNDAETINRRIQMIESRERARQAKLQANKAQASTAASADGLQPVTVASAPARSEPETRTAESNGADASIDFAAAEKFLTAALDSGNGDVDKLAADGDKSVADRDYDAAVDTYNEAKEAAQGAFGRDSIKLVPVLMRLSAAFHARDLMEQDDEGTSYSDPIDNAMLALSLLVKEGGMQDPRLVPVLVTMAALSDLDGEHYKAGTYIGMIENIEAARRNSLR